MSGSHRTAAHSSCLQACRTCLVMGLEAEMQVPIVCVHVADMSDSWLVL